MTYQNKLFWSLDLSFNWCGLLLWQSRLTSAVDIKSVNRPIEEGSQHILRYSCCSCLGQWNYDICEHFTKTICTLIKLQYFTERQVTRKTSRYLHNSTRHVHWFLAASIISHLPAGCVIGLVTNIPFLGAHRQYCHLIPLTNGYQGGSSVFLVSLLFVSIEIILLMITKLTSWSWTLLEKQTIVQLLKNFPAFYGTRRFVTVFIRVLHRPLSWARSVQSIPPHPTVSMMWLVNTKQLVEW
jgi:hypothetical protein